MKFVSYLQNSPGAFCVLVKAPSADLSKELTKNSSILVTQCYVSSVCTVCIHVSFQISKYDIEESIKREMSGDLKDGMTAIGNTEKKMI